MWKYVAGVGTIATVGLVAGRRAAMRVIDDLMHLKPNPVASFQIVAGATQEGRPRPMFVWSVGTSNLPRYRDRGQYLAWGAFRSWLQMARAARKDGVDLTGQLVNSFRTWTHQRSVGGAPAGQSAHQRGTAVDVNTVGAEGSAAQTWLERHGHEYGWSRTYTGRHHWEYFG